MERGCQRIWAKKVSNLCALEQKGSWTIKTLGIELDEIVTTTKAKKGKKMK